MHIITDFNFEYLIFILIVGYFDDKLWKLKYKLTWYSEYKIVSLKIIQIVLRQDISMVKGV